MVVLSERETNKLLDIIVNNFVNIYKVIYHFSPKEAEKFKLRNAEKKKKDHHHENEQCCNHHHHMLLEYNEMNYLEL